jgi:cellulose synthase/poly-beta-1,6-N-acetylglucosamine synthase-like glycosyltransferase
VRVAVVIVSKDDPRIHECLEAVFNQDYPDPFEVVLVDNASKEDHFLSIRRRWSSKPGFRLLQIAGNFSGAWNQGAFGTNADVVARVDGDTIPQPNWLARLVEPLRRRPEIAWTAGAVVGPTPLRSLTQRYFHHRTLGYQGRLKGTHLPTDAVASWNVAYRLSALREVGGYDPWQRSSIDWDLHKRLSRADKKGVFVEDAVLVHDHPTRLRDFYRKEAWYRTGHYQMLLKYGLLAVGSTFILPLGYLGLLGLYTAGFLVHMQLLLVALVLTLALFVRQWAVAIMEKDEVWWIRPAFRFVEAVAATHGLLRGFFRFGVRRRPIPGA